MSNPAPRFIHLRTHSEHSLLEGAIPVAMLPKLAAEMGMPVQIAFDAGHCVLVVSEMNAVVINPLLHALWIACHPAA